MDVLLLLNDMICEVAGLKNAVSGDVLTAATVTVSVKDLDGVDVPGVSWPVTATGDGAGTYQATLPDTMSLTLGQKYRIDIDADAGGGLRGHWVRSARALNRED
jgi:Ethanolamine utilization protein EutJ (predicted chaperonin)